MDSICNIVQEAGIKTIPKKKKCKKVKWLSEEALQIAASRREPKKVMAPHSSTLAWRIPGTEESGRLPSMGLYRVGHN